MLQSPRTDGVGADPQLVADAHDQRGVFTAAQAYDAGYTPSEIQRLRSRGELVSVRRGVYAVARTWRELAPWDRHLVELVALQLVLNEPAVVSHLSAGVIHGLSLLAPDLATLHVTRPGRAGARLEARVHHHVADLPDRDVSSFEGWKVTSLARTGIDIARESDLPQGVAALDSVLGRGLDRALLIEVLLSCSSWPGARMACHALALADGRSANAGESWSRVELFRHGVPPTDIQHKLYDDDGLIGIADFVWLPDRVVGELDGRLKYKVPDGAHPDQAGEVVWAEKRREDRIRALGYEVVRWVYADLSHPDRLAGRVRQALGRGAARRRTTA